MTKVALCRSCGDVLVSTFAWRGYEFVCLGCGRLETWLGPKAGEETPERLARIEETKAEWRELAAGLLSGGVRLTACRDAGGGCSKGEEHLWHATVEQVAAHDAAVARIGARIGRAP